MTTLYFCLARSPECKREHQFQPNINDNTALLSRPIARMARASLQTKSTTILHFCQARSPECKREHEFQPVRSFFKRVGGIGGNPNNPPRGLPPHRRVNSRRPYKRTCMGLSGGLPLTGGMVAAISRPEDNPPTKNLYSYSLSLLHLSKTAL